MTVQAQFKIEVDWADDEDNPYGHTASDVTNLLNSWKHTYGNSVYLEDREARIDVGEGQVQLRYDESTFGSLGTVSQDQLSAIHKVKLTEIVTDTVCWEGLIEYSTEFDAHFTSGDVLQFNLHGKGYLKDGGTWTYPRGSSAGGTVEQGLQVVVSEDPIEPDDFILTGTIGSALPTRMIVTTDGRLIGQNSAGKIIELEGETRREYDAIAVNKTETDPGRDGRFTTNVTRTYKNYVISQTDASDFSGTSSVTGDIPDYMQTLPDGRAVGRLADGTLVELDGPDRRDDDPIFNDSTRHFQGFLRSSPITVTRHILNTTNTGRMYAMDNQSDIADAYTHTGFFVENFQFPDGNLRCFTQYDGNFYTVDDATEVLVKFPIDDPPTSSGSATTVTATTTRLYFYNSGSGEIIVTDRRGRRQETEDVTLDVGDGQITNIPSIKIRNNKIYAMNSADREINVYSISGVSESGSDFDLGSTNNMFSCDVSGDTHFVLHDASLAATNRISGYELINGTRTLTDYIELATAGFYSDFVVDGTTIYALQQSSRKIEVYEKDDSGTSYTYMPNKTISLTRGTWTSIDKVGDLLIVNDTIEQVVVKMDVNVNPGIQLHASKWRGIAVTEDRILILSETEETLFSYMHDGTAVTAENLVLGTGRPDTNNVRWTGVAVANGITYLIDLLSLAILAVDEDGELLLSSVIRIPGGTFYNGLTVSDDYIWICDQIQNRAIAYTFEGAVVPTASIQLATGRRRYTGIAFTPANHIVLADEDVDEDNYIVPATVGVVDETTQYDGPMVAYSNALWRSRRVTGREYISYVSGSAPSEVSLRPTDNWRYTEHPYRPNVDTMRVQWSWPAGEIETRTWDNREFAGHNYSRGSNGQIFVSSAQRVGATTSNELRSGTRTYFTHNDTLYLVRDGSLYTVSDISTGDATTTLVGSLANAINAPRAITQIDNYNYLISNDGSGWYNNNDLDNTPTLIDSFASGIRPHAISYTPTHIYVYNLTNGNYWRADRERDLLSSHDSTIERAIAATVSRVTKVTTFTGPVFHFQNRIWRARRTRTRTYNSWTNGSEDPIPGGDWLDSVTYDSGIHSTTTEYSWTAGEHDISNTDIWDFAGHGTSRGADGTLTINTNPSSGGNVPTTLRTGNPLYFPAAGGLYVIQNQSLYLATGFPGSSELSLIGTLSSAINNPKAAIYVGDRAYVLGNSGTNIYQFDNLNGTSVSDLGALPSSLSLEYLSYTAEQIYAYEQSGTREIYQVDRFTRTAREPEPDDPESEIRSLVDSFDIEYFDETDEGYGKPAFDYVRALAEDLGVEFNESKSSPVPDTVSGLVRYGPQSDITLADRAYTGWTGQFMFALRDGNIAVAFPGDLRITNRALTFNNYRIIGPFEVKQNRRMITNSAYAQGIERL